MSNPTTPPADLTEAHKAALNELKAAHAARQRVVNDATKPSTDASWHLEYNAADAAIDAANAHVEVHEALVAWEEAKAKQHAASVKWAQSKSTPAV